MKFIFLVIAFLMSSSYLKANNKIICDTTYLEYHELINQAERYYFLNSNVDSSLAYYDKAFEQYSFIFLKDLVNAAQICVYERKLKFREYLLKGFKFGLQIKHLNHFPLLKTLTDDLFSDTSFMERAILNRKIYLKNINYEYLLKVYDLGIDDQIKKSQPDEVYAIEKRRNIQKIKGWINKYGFPSSKLIGIDDKDIFKNIGKPNFDIDNRKYKFSSKIDYYTTEDKSLSNTISMILLIHNQCTFLEFKEILYTAMLNGEIHPREIGCLYDNMYRDVNSIFYICKYPDVQNGLFYLNLFCDYKKFSIDKEKVNNLRSQWNIVEVEVDEKKKQFEEKYGFKLFYGFWKCM